MFRFALPILAAAAASLSAQEVPVDIESYAAACGVSIEEKEGRIHVLWPLGDGEFEMCDLDLRPGRPLIERLGVFEAAEGVAQPPLAAMDPFFSVTAGTRVAPSGRPPDMSIWNVFFDTPANRPHETHVGKFELKWAKVTSEGKRATVMLGDLAIGPFTGEIAFTFYAGCRLVQIEAIVSTKDDRRAFFYDAGLAGEAPRFAQVVWTDTEGRLQEMAVDPKAEARPIAVRHRAIVAEGRTGAVAAFPPPHQFFFPRDSTDNQKTVWAGAGYQGLAGKYGIGIRQTTKGGGGFVPWFNAPPATRQRLGLFLVPVRGKADRAFREALRYTNNDRFPSLQGHITFTSHYHMAVAVTAMEEARKGRPWNPEFAGVFKDMGVNAVHLAEFHGDGHQKDPGPLRIPEVESMFNECRRLSDERILFIPGEEINDFLGIKEPGKHPGHWMTLFPKPVLWTMQRAEGQPFAEPHAKHGTLYRVGSRADVVELLKRENGLAWAAHPRIKASSWTPDIFRNEDFYLADFWLGGAWKAMPADLSRERLGERCLDLLDDMANWGQKKYLPGEVDVFKIDHTHELYGHMNINYLRLDRLPRYDEGWEPILKVLREGKFFVTTGEILIREFAAGGKASGETLALPDDGRPEVKVSLEWTFPLKFLELISGDGARVYRERIDAPEALAFEERTWTLRPDLRGRKWARIEAWDVAVNGAYSQPVWIESP